MQSVRNSQPSLRCGVPETGQLSVLRQLHSRGADLSTLSSDGTLTLPPAVVELLSELAEEDATEAAAAVTAAATADEPASITS